MAAAYSLASLLLLPACLIDTPFLFFFSLTARRLAQLLADDLDKDFDPAEHDRRMAALFGDDYYAEGEAEAAAAAAAAAAGASGAAAADADTADDADGDDDDNDDGAKGVPAWVFGDGPRPSWAGPSAEELAQGVDDGFGPVRREDGGDDEGEDDAMGEADEEEEVDEAVSGRRKSKRARKAARKQSEVARVKALIVKSGGLDGLSGGGDAELEDTDDVLALGFEDVIAGGIRTRFKYTPVQVGDFGLSAEEILLADDRELNRFLGLRRLAPYRDREWEMPSKVRKRAVAELRKKLKDDLLQRAPELVAVTSEEGAAPAADGAQDDHQHQQGEESSAADEAAVSSSSAAAAAAATGGEGGEGGKKKRRRKHKSKGAAAGGAAGGDGDAEGENDDAGAIEAAVPLLVPAPSADVIGNASSSGGFKRKRDDQHDDGHETNKKEKKHKKDRHQQHGGGSSRDSKHRGSGKEGPSGGLGDRMVTLPTGALMKKSRLESYGL